MIVTPNKRVDLGPRVLSRSSRKSYSAKPSVARSVDRFWLMPRLSAATLRNVMSNYSSRIGDKPHTSPAFPTIRGTFYVDHILQNASSRGDRTAVMLCGPRRRAREFLRLMENGHVCPRSRTMLVVVGLRLRKPGQQIEFLQFATTGRYSGGHREHRSIAHPCYERLTGRERLRVIDALSRESLIMSREFSIMQPKALS